VEILEDKEHRLAPGLLEPESLDGVEYPLAPLGGIEGRPGAVLAWHIEQSKQRVGARRQGRIEREQPSPQLLANLGWVIAVLDPEVSLEKLDRGLIRRRLAVLERARPQDEPALATVSLRDFPDEP
jgi:hypothetical protein